MANYGRRCRELDALPPPELRRRIEDAIRAEIVWEAWERCERVERAEADALNEVIANWRGERG